MIKVTTESGRVYLINDGLWCRLPKSGERTEGWHSIWKLQSGNVLAFPWNDKFNSFVDVESPIVGKHMFISGKDEWWTSTIVVSVEEVEDSNG